MVSDTAIPATLTAIHLALATVRRHRAGGPTVLSPFILPSFFFAAAPWLWTTATGLIAGLAAHIVWFVACEIVAPPAGASVRPAAAAPAAPAGRPPASAPTHVPKPVRPRPAGFVMAPVLAVIEECTGIKTFRLARPEGFEFAAGQFIAVRVRIDGRPHVRCYSISSSPDSRGYLEISVRRQGTVSTMLHATVRTGSLLAIHAPAGTFAYPAGDDRPLALIAGGVGITPLMSMLRYAISSDPTRPIVLLYSGRREDEVAFVSELRLIAERHPQVRVTLTLTQPVAATRWRTGRIDLALIRQQVPHLEQTMFCVCGPAAMIADTERLLREAAVPERQIRFERFETTSAAAVLNPVAESTPATAAAQHTIRFAVSDRSVCARPSQTLLEAAEGDGVTIASSCRSGVCQSCRTRLIEGDADCRSDVLDPEDRAAGFILPCVSWPTGDCVLEA